MLHVCVYEEKVSNIANTEADFLPLVTDKGYGQ